MIDKEIEDHSKRFKRECKILLLGMHPLAFPCGSLKASLHRLRRIGEEHNSQTDEDYPQRGVYRC